MSILSQISLACNFIVLKDVLSVMFENDNDIDLKLVSDMHTTLDAILETAYLAKGVEAYLRGVIEDEELFGKLVDDDAVRVCLLLALEEHLQGLCKSRNYVPTYTLSGFAWSFKYYTAYIPRSAPTRYPDLFDEYLKKLAASRKRGKLDTRDLPIIRRCDTTSVEEIRVKDCVISELNYRVYKLETIIKVLGHERKGVLLDKSIVADLFLNISSEYLDALNEEFHKLYQTSFIDNRPAENGLDYDDDLVKDYLIQEELRVKQEEEERCRLEEFKMKEALSKITNGKRSQRYGAFSAYYWRDTFVNAKRDRPLNALNDQDMTQFLKDVTPWVEDLSRYNKAPDRVHLTDAFDIFLSHQCNNRDLS
ncbi:hypothetical protein Tco_0621134, partial [Tanacetum coccineum]